MVERRSGDPKGDAQVLKMPSAKGSAAQAPGRGRVDPEAMHAFADALARLLVQYPRGEREQVLMGAYVDADGRLRSTHQMLQALPD